MESHLGLAIQYCSQCGKLCEDEHRCLEHRRKVSALYLLYKVITECILLRISIILLQLVIIELQLL